MRANHPVTPLQAGLAIASLLVLLLTPTLPARGADPAGSLRNLLEKGKASAVVKKAAAWIGKDPLREDADEIRDLWAQAAYRLLEEEPDLIAAQAFSVRFPGHALADAAAEIEAEQALAAAGVLDRETVYLGVARQHRGTSAADEAEAVAEAMSFRRVSDGGEADALRGHALRYPWGEHAPAAREAELAAAFSLADGAGEAAGWQRLLDRYPEHPRRDEARQRLEESSWDEFREAGGGGGELWAFVAEHPDSDEGWNAAVEAMGQTVRVLVPGGAAATGTLDSVLASLTVEMGVTPPPGYELGIEVEVDLGEGWVDWSAAAGTLAGPLALGDGALTGLGALSDARMSGETIAWSTPTPVCAAFAGPVPVRARVTMIHRDRRHEQTSAFQVAGPCPGARRMVLSQLGDDLRGPVALVVRETESGLDRVAAPPSVMHETWTCSHVTAVEPLGVTLACGKTTARLGWDEGVMWLRRTDPSVPTTERVALTPVADLPGTPLTVVTPRRGRPPVLQDSAGGTWADLGDREAVATPALAPSAFGAVPGATAATPPVPPGKERPVEGSSVPLPEGAARRSVEVDGLSSSDIRRWAATVNALGLTGAAPKQLLAIDGDAPGGIDRAVLANVFTQDVGGLMQVHGMLLAAEGEGEFDWYQAVLLPGLGDLSRAHWERFELDGHVYLRTAGPSPVDGACTRLFTLRDGGGHLVVDLTDLDCR